MAERINGKKPHVISEVLLEGDEGTLSGPIEEVIGMLQEIQVEAALRNAYDVYVSIAADTKEEPYDTTQYAVVEVEISCKRLETQKEVDDRIAAWKKRNAAAKKGAATRKATKEKEELKLYKKLQAKFGDPRYGKRAIYYYYKKG